MSKPSDYEDGAFYWVRQGDDWTVAKRLKDEWLQLADDFLRADGDFDEIGPCIGKEPPVSPRITVTAPPALGTAEVIRGSVRYTPGTGALGKDGFTYTVA